MKESDRVEITTVTEDLDITKVTVTIKKSKIEDAGTYEIIAENREGKSVTSLVLNVTGMKFCCHKFLKLLITLEIFNSSFIIHSLFFNRITMIYRDIFHTMYFIYSIVHLKTFNEVCHVPKHMTFHLFKI